MRWEIKHKIAFPFRVYIRNVPGLGHVFGGRWVWLRKYTRVYVWSENEQRMRTWHAALGWKTLAEMGITFDGLSDAIADGERH